MLLKKGDRVKLNVCTIGGNKGIGTIFTDQPHDRAVVRMILDGKTSIVDACRHEVSKLRGQ